MRPHETTLAVALEFRREAYELSKSEFAAILGLSLAHYGEILNGHRDIPKGAMRRPTPSACRPEPCFQPAFRYAPHRRYRRGNDPNHQPRHPRPFGPGRWHFGSTGSRKRTMTTNNLVPIEAPQPPHRWPRRLDGHLRAGRCVSALPKPSHGPGSEDDDKRVYRTLQAALWKLAPA